MSKRFWTVGLPISIAWSLILWTLLFWAVSAFAMTYYIRADGTVTAVNKTNATGCGSPSTAMNIAQENAATFSPGDTIVLCDSGGPFSPVADAVLIPPSSGTSGNPITYTASGSPIINGGISLMSGWSNTWNANVSISQTLNQGPLTGNYAMRYTINANTFSTNGTTINLTFESSSSGLTTISGVYIGQKASTGDAWAMQSGTVSQFTFSGNNSATIPTGASITTDNLAYSFNKANTYIISVGYSYASVPYGSVYNYGISYGKSGDAANAGTLDPSGYSSLANTWHGLLSVTLVDAGSGSQANTWAVPLSKQTYWVLFNGSPGNYKTSLSGLSNNMDWYWANGYLYTYRTDDANPDMIYSSINAAQAQYCINDVNTVNYITVNGISCTLANARGISSAGNNWTIENGNLTYIGNGLSGYGHAILAKGNNALVTDCTCNYVNDRGIEFTGDNDLAIHNKVAHCWNGLTYTSGSGAGQGISLDGTSDQALYNFVDTSYHCINTGGSSDSLVANNVCVTWGTNGIDHESGVSGHPAKIYNNTIIHEDGSGWRSGHGIVCQHNGNYADIRNNIVVVNGTQTNVNYEAIAFDTTSTTGITLDNNLYYLVPGTTGTIGEFGSSATQYSTLSAWKAAIAGTISGGDAHSISANPLLVNASGFFSFPTDFKLLPNSPAIDAGTDVGLAQDFAGKTVPGPKGVSIGAYEWYPIGHNEPLWYDPYHLGHRRY